MIVRTVQMRMTIYILDEKSLRLQFVQTLKKNREEKTG